MILKPKNVSHVKCFAVVYLSCIFLLSLHEKCQHSELFWSVFSRIKAEYREPYLVQVRKNTDQNNFKYRHFLLTVSSFGAPIFKYYPNGKRWFLHSNKLRLYFFCSRGRTLFFFREPCLCMIRRLF